MNDYISNDQSVVLGRGLKLLRNSHVVSEYKNTRKLQLIATTRIETLEFIVWAQTYLLSHGHPEGGAKESKCSTCIWSFGQTFLWSKY